MPTPEEYRYCTRLGMTQSECAEHLGVSRAAVTKAKQRLGLEFGDGMALSQGREWQERGDTAQSFYPWAEMAVGDWLEPDGYAGTVAFRASKRLAPKVFCSITSKGRNIVRRAA